MRVMIWLGPAVDKAGCGQGGCCCRNDSLWLGPALIDTSCMKLSRDRGQCRPTSDRSASVKLFH
jgi:hypothetical protein